MQSFKIIKVILAVVFFSNLCYSQTGWYQVNSGTNKSLNSVCFINLNTGFSVGASGTLLKTVNMGNSWERINLGDTSFSFRKIYFKDQNTGFILGHNIFITPSEIYTRIYQTTNAGESWFISQPRIENILLNSIEFVNTNTGYAAGGLYSGGANGFYKTTNGGMTWVEIPTGLNGVIGSEKFINANTGLIFAENKIYKTTNSGVSWISVFQAPLGLYYGASEISFVNGTTGFAANGYYTIIGGTVLGPPKRFILKTTNQGNSWNYILNDSSGIILSMVCLSESVIYASGMGEFNTSNGFIIRTTNTGLAWSNESIPYSITLTDVKNSNLKGISVGFNGAIFKKDNIVSVTQISTVVPESIKLHQNYPNPFNPATSIKFEINKAGFTQLKVFDITGKEIKNLVEAFKEAGTYEAKFDGVSLNSGIYFYKLMTNGTTITKSMVLVK